MIQCTNSTKRAYLSKNSFRVEISMDRDLLILKGYLLGKNNDSWGEQ